MKLFIAALALLIAKTASADTSVGPDSYGSAALKRGSTTVATINPATPQACHDRAVVDTEARDVTTAYTCGNLSFTVTWTAAPVVCPTNPPADTTRQTACPSPLYGTYAQTQGWTNHGSPTCWVNDAGWVDVPPSQSTCSSTPPSGTYSTSFATAEAPISEGGNWARANNSWTNVTTVDGFARGTNGITNSYDDSYSILQGTQYGSDYTITAVAARTAALPNAAVNETEILVRCTDTTSSAKCIELSFVADGQFAVAVWNGPFGSFMGLNSEISSTSMGKVTEGTVFKATISGSVLKAWRGSTLIFQNSHVPYATGNPGMGFFIRPGYVQGFGWRSYSVTTP